MRRIAFFYLKDPKKREYSYVKFLFDSLKRIAEKVVIIAQNHDEINKIEEFSVCSFVVSKKDKSIDGYMEGLLAYNRYSLLDYEEIVCVDDTFFGPLVKIENIFSYIESQICDYWYLFMQPSPVEPLMQ